LTTGALFLPFGFEKKTGYDPNYGVGGQVPSAPCIRRLPRTSQIRTPSLAVVNVAAEVKDSQPRIVEHVLVLPLAM